MQYGDCPQAKALLTGLQGVGHVIADVAYDADPLRTFIADDLGATAQFKANPRRATAPPIVERQQRATPERDHHGFFLDRQR